MAEVHIYGHGWILSGAGLGRQHGDTREKLLGGRSEMGYHSDVRNRWSET